MKKRLLIFAFCTMLIASLCGCGQTDEVQPQEVVSESSSDEVIEVTEEAIGEKEEVFEIERPYHEAYPKFEPVKLARGRENIVNSNLLPKVILTVEDKDFMIDKDSYVETMVEITNAGEYNMEPTLAGIAIRGNSTSHLAKRPLKLKFDEKQSVFGSEKAKKWTLLANCYDKSLLHNYVAYELYQYVTPDDTFGSMCQMVELYCNDSFLGIYTLCDQVEVGESRINVGKEPGETPEETGYLIEHDYRISYDDPENGEEGLNWFWMSKLNECFEVKSPEVEGDKSYTTYIRDYMDQVYDAAVNQDFDKIQELIDVDSFINGFLVAEIVKSNDINHTSVFYHKPAGGKLAFGPLWDCDLAFGCGERPTADGLVCTKNFLFGALYEVPEFKELYTARFNEICDDVEQHMLARIDEAVETYHDDLKYDYDFWESNYDYCGEELIGLTYDEQIDYMKEWIRTRMNFLREEINK